MNLNDIVLMQVLPEEFMQIYFSWYSSAPNLNQVNLAKIVTSIAFPDYQTLLARFLGDTRADKLSVNDTGKWKRYYSRKIRGQDKRDIERIARADRIKRGNIELYFKEYPYARTDVKLTFAEYPAGIACYDLFFPSDLAGWFTWQETPNLQKQRTCAILAPNEMPGANPNQ